MSNAKTRVGIYGMGAFGTGMAHVLSQSEHIDVYVSGRNPDVLSEISEKHTNTAYLGNLVLSPAIQVVKSLDELIREVDVIELAVPAQAIHDVVSCASTIGLVEQHQPIVIHLAKGIDTQQLKRPSEIIREFWPVKHIGLKAGPSFARQMAEGHFTWLMLGLEDPMVAAQLQSRFRTENFAVSVTKDVARLELSSAYKNILAIFSGMLDSYYEGRNANIRGMLLEKGFDEIGRFVDALNGAHHADAYVRSFGLGDFGITATDDNSRNRQLGLLLGKGLSTKAALEKMAVKTVEGMHTVRAVLRMAKRHSVQLPIAWETFMVVHRNRSPKKSVRALIDMASST